MRWLLLLTLTVTSPLWAYDRITGEAFATRSEVLATQAMAATSQPLATQVALQVMRDGGNAVDAAIAANAMLGLVEPTGAGIGGDMFAIVWDAKTQKLYGLNGSGRSPAGLEYAEFSRRGLTQIPAFGPLPVSVPGAVSGWFALHEKFGQLPMTKILSPAIHYAREGFPVSQVVAYYWQVNADRIGHYPGFAETFLPDGKVPAAGDIFKNPALAATYEKIASGGEAAFYKGDIARTIATYMQEQDGFLSYDDLAAHRSQWVEPVSVNYRGYDVWELPPNGQGIAALQILNIMEQYDVEGMGFGSADYIHTFVEAKKLAFADRAKFYADPEFSPAPLSQLLSKDYARERRQLIDPARAAKRADAGINEGDTVYLTVADAKGNMVSLIQSNYRGMGSGMTPPGLGFVLQNRGQLLTLEQGHANVYAPGKRPFHTIIPAFVTKNNQPWLSFGVMGGATQPQMHAQILMNLIDFGMNLQEAGDAPRIVHTGSSSPTGARMRDGGVVHLESGFGMMTQRALIERGHVLQPALGVYGGYQAILRDRANQVYHGASESRKDGQAAGY